MTKNKLIFSFILFLAMFFSGTYMMKYLQTSLHGTTMILGVDLYPRYVGTTAVLHGESPYSQQTRKSIWLAIYGSKETPNGNLFGFYYPPAITTLLMPFILMGIPASLAAALWCAFLWAALSTALTFWVMEFRKIKNGFLIVPMLFVSGWLFRPAFSNYFLGQFALFSVLAGIAAWFAFRKRQPVLAGIFAALSLVKPSLTIIPIGLLLVEHLQGKKGIGAFAVTSLVLYLPPTFLIGWWLPDFIADISNYALENSVGWSIMNIGTFAGLSWLLTSILLIGLGIYRKNSLLTFSAAFALNAIFIPHTADYDLVAFIPLLVYLGNSWIKNKNGKILHRFLFFTLLWYPWLSLFAFLVLIKDRGAVEDWYRFVWLTYPPAVLLFTVLTETPLLQTFTQRLRRENKNA